MLYVGKNVQHRRQDALQQQREIFAKMRGAEFRFELREKSDEELAEYAWGHE